MTMLDQFAAAEKAIGTAEAERSKLESARDKLASKLVALDARQADLAKRCKEMRADAAITGLRPAVLMTAEKDRDETTREHVETVETLATLDERIADACRAEKHAHDDLARLMRDGAKTLLPAAKQAARDAFAAAYAAQRRYCTIAETASKGSWDSHEQLMHGPPDAPESIPRVAEREGIREANLRPTMPLAPMTLDDLKAALR